LPPALEQRALPRHVRDLLISTFKIVTDELRFSLAATVKDFEQQVRQRISATMEPSDRARWERSREVIERSREELSIYFHSALETELANLQAPQIVRGHLQTRYRSGDSMALISDLEIEETSLLTDASSRAELRHSLQLFLLGQRFGVLAGRPAFDVETLPVGPQALCRSIRRATERLGLDADVRLLSYRAFDRQLLPGFGSLVEKVNADLARNGVLPNLRYIPIRARRTEQKPGISPAPAEIGEHKLSVVGKSMERTATGVPREVPAETRAPAADHSNELASDAGFLLLRKLTASRRQLLGKLNPDRSVEGRGAAHVVSSSELQQALASLQDRPAVAMLRQGRVSARTIGHIRQDVLALLRTTSPNQEAPTLADEHNDTLDLVGMLYDSLTRNVKAGSTTSALLSKLQVPVMRVALQDSTFFTRMEHPARQLLNSVAETAINWLGEDSSDGSLVNQMHAIVDRAVNEYRGDSAAFGPVLQELTHNLQTLSRKAEVAERRHLEAARGREKLMLAREHASRNVDALIKDLKLPRFTRTMIVQAWTDAMALTALRHGADSPAWQRQLELARDLVEIAIHPDDNPHSPDARKQIQREIEQGLEAIGYQIGDVIAIANQLVFPGVACSDDAGSRTELTMRLKAQARLGQESTGKSERRIRLSPAEAVELDRVKRAAIGTWFEFVINPEGARVRRRLAWLSMATGDVLFVNTRGQKNAEYTLESLARMLLHGQVEILEHKQGTLIDQAWENVLAGLRSFAAPEPSGAIAP
jgi:hypothetical protein